LGGCGATDGALAFGGGTTATLNTTEKYTGFTGTFWATTSPLSAAKNYLGVVGDSTSALSFGGGTTAAINTTEKWADTA